MTKIHITQWSVAIFLSLFGINHSSMITGGRVHIITTSPAHEIVRPCPTMPLFGPYGVRTTGLL